LNIAAVVKTHCRRKAAAKTAAHRSARNKKTPMEVKQE
jgi:hypothetical protein